MSASARIPACVSCSRADWSLERSVVRVSALPPNPVLTPAMFQKVQHHEEFTTRRRLRVVGVIPYMLCPFVRCSSSILTLLCIESQRSLVISMYASHSYLLSKISQAIFCAFYVRSTAYFPTAMTLATSTLVPSMKTFPDVRTRSILFHRLVGSSDVNVVVDTSLSSKALPTPSPVRATG